MDDFPHNGECSVEGVSQFLDVRDPHLVESSFHFCRSDLGLSHDESDVLHVLGIISAHHFRQDQIHGMWSKEAQPPGNRASDRHEMEFPVWTKEDLTSQKRWVM